MSHVTCDTCPHVCVCGGGVETLCRACVFSTEGHVILVNIFFNCCPNSNKATAKRCRVDAAEERRAGVGRRAGAPEHKGG
jgi:hypothetical protein